MKSNRNGIPLEEWQNFIIKNMVIERFGAGETLKKLENEVNKEYYGVELPTTTGDNLRHALKNLGYKKSKEQGIYYKENKQFIVDFMNRIDIEEVTEDIASKRYYEYFRDGFYGSEERETITLEFDKKIYNEYVELAEKYTCVDEEDYINMVLLKHLDEVKPIDRKIEFALRDMKENGCKDEEINFLITKVKEGYDFWKVWGFVEDGYFIDGIDLDEYLQEEKRIAEKIKERRMEKDE